MSRINPRLRTQNIPEPIYRFDNLPLCQSLSLAILCLLILLALSPSLSHAQTPPLNQIQRIPMPGVTGRIDHLACDAAGKRLFVAALGNGTVEVIDLTAAKVVHSIGKLEEPQGLLFEPKSQHLFVATGGDGACRVYDASKPDYTLLATIDAGPDADNVRLVPETGAILVGYGEGASSGALAVIDPNTLKKTADIPLAGHAEAFQVERGGKRAFVNIPTHQQVAVVDLEKRAVSATWELKDPAQNFPMFLDSAHNLLFSGCRKPAAVQVFDLTSGKKVTRFEIAGDTDDLFYDARRHQLYVICGAGQVDVFNQSAPDSYPRLASIPSAPGARTGLFVPTLDRLFVAAPKRDGNEAAILVYSPGP